MLQHCSQWSPWKNKQNYNLTVSKFRRSLNPQILNCKRPDLQESTAKAADGPQGLADRLRREVLFNIHAHPRLRMRVLGFRGAGLEFTGFEVWDLGSSWVLIRSRSAALKLCIAYGHGHGSKKLGLSTAELQSVLISGASGLGFRLSRGFGPNVHLTCRERLRAINQNKSIHRALFGYARPSAPG